MIKSVWQKSDLWDKFFQLGLLVNFVLNMFIFLADPSWHQFVHACLWLAVWYVVVRAEFFEAVYRESWPVRKFGADVGLKLHAYETLFIEKDGDSYVITSFSDGDSEGDN